ncbi:RNase H domain-containing protein [Trichonephila clavipes]|nr:RNase H domain-containing protein [Trichonephila clavipes]
MNVALYSVTAGLLAIVFVILNQDQVMRTALERAPPRLRRNEVADDLLKAATSNPMDPEDHMVLTSTEIYSRAKELICRTWVVPPVHSWLYTRNAQTYGQKSSGRPDNDASWNSLRSGSFLACHVSSRQLQIFEYFLQLKEQASFTPNS